MGRTSFRSIYRREVERGVARYRPAPVVTEADLIPLPPPVQRYLRLAGVVGRSRVVNLRARLRGTIRSAPTARWMEFSGEQHNFFDEPSRVFLIRARMLGIPVDALHVYTGPSAVMRVRALGCVSLADARGPEMNRGETVTLFNDMCVLAPGTLVDPSIRWEEIDASSVRATFTNAGNAIGAVLVFGPDGGLVNFHSEDRYQSMDGKTFRRLPWSTPLGAYRDFAGTRLAGAGEAVWHTPAGEFVYIRMEMLAIEYNVDSVSTR